jgi:hypothetical protein
MARKPTTLPQPGDNSEAKEADLLALMAEMRPALDQVELAKSLVKKANDAYAVIRNKAEPLGFELAILDKALKLERQPTQRRLHQAQADEEYFVMKTLGLPVAAIQGVLELGTDEERTEKHWADQGFQAGIRGDAAIPPDVVPPHLHQTWLSRRADGAEYSAWGKANAGGKPDQRATTIDEARAARTANGGDAAPAGGDEPVPEATPATPARNGRRKAADPDPLLSP